MEKIGGMVGSNSEQCSEFAAKRKRENDSSACVETKRRRDEEIEVGQTLSGFGQIELADFDNLQLDKGMGVMKQSGDSFVVAFSDDLIPAIKRIVGTSGHHAANGLEWRVIGDRNVLIIKAFEGTDFQQRAAQYFTQINLMNVSGDVVTNNFTVNSASRVARKDVTVEDLQCLQGHFSADTVRKLATWISDTSQDSLVKLYCSRADTVRYSSGCFYVYRGHVWIKDTECTSAISDIIDTTSSILLEARKILREMGNTRFECIIQDGVHRVRSFSYALAMSKLCKKQLEDNAFVGKLDSDWTIIPFTNGVYSIRDKVFREHRREDYITKTVGYEYDPSVQSEALDKFLEDIMPSREQLQYLLWTCATFLNGGVPNDQLVFIVGTGGNGKSMFMDLLNMALGDLCSTVSSTLFTRDDTGSNIPRPDLMALRSRRFGYITEPDTGTLNNAVVKKLCGSDWISCRNLYSQQVSFKFRTKFAIVCNDLPEVTSGDDAIWRRIRVIKFSTKFVSVPTTLLEKKLDPTLSDTITHTVAWRQALMNKLLDLLDVSTPTPIEFLVLRQSYMDTSNDFSNFLARHVRRSPGAVLQFSNVLKLYYEKEEDIPKTRTREHTKLFKLITKHIEETCTDHEDVKYVHGQKQGSKSVRGWTGLDIDV
jgi:P4 family phage/plasmid primase-like protien